MRAQCDPHRPHAIQRDLRAPYFDVLGRVGLADIKTCAAGAAELLNVKPAAGTKEAGHESR